MRARPAALAALLALPSAAARADAPAEAGLVLSFRAGWGTPFGTIDGGAPAPDRVTGALGDAVRAKVPLWIELGYRFGGHAQGDLYFEAAPASLRASCPAGSSCGATDVRFGVALQLHARPRALLDPWLGAGIGIEVLTADVPSPDGTAAAWNVTWSGIEAPLQAGLDLRLGTGFTVGPFVQVSLAQFTSVAAHPSGATSAASSIDRRATHGWTEVGLKASLRL